MSQTGSIRAVVFLALTALTGAASSAATNPADSLLALPGVSATTSVDSGTATSPVVITSPSASNPASFAVVKGRVVDRGTRQPVPFVEVRLEEARQANLADNAGRFRFDHVPPGRCTLHVTRIGYRPFADSLNIQPGDTLQLDVELAGQSLQLDHKIEVTALRDSAELTAGQTPVSLAGKDLRARLGGTVAATLSEEAGVAERTMGAATARPVLRGLSGNRLMVLEDGVSTGDLSATSDDHAVVIEPLNARRIDIVRGPAALLYGSSVLGGVVNVEREAVPDQRPGHVRGTASTQGESVNDGVAGQFRVDGPLGPTAWTLEATGRRAGDTVTPSGTLNNSQLDSWTASAGASWIGKRGYLGTSANFYKSAYGVPGGFLGGHPFGADIELDRRQYEARGVLQIHPIGLQSLDTRFKYSRYFHQELESHDVCGVSFGLLTYDFSSQLHFDTGSRLGSGAAGVAGEFRDYANGCLSFIPPTTERTLSAFAFDRTRMGRLELQGSARFDTRLVTPSRLEVNKAGRIREREFSGTSGALAARWSFTDHLSVGSTASLAFRPPALEELFSDGPHLAAFAYEIGNANLEAESGRGIEIAATWEPERGALRLRGFYNFIDEFIQVFDTGEIEYGPGEYGYLARFQYDGRDAHMVGGELEAAFRVTPHVQVRGSAGYVRGEIASTGEPLPRIPPLSGRLSVAWAHGDWDFQGNVAGAAEQNRLGDFEEPTAEYAILGASLGWQRALHGHLHSIVVRLENATDAEYRNHISRLKSIMPEAGRNLALLYRVSFF